jgi:STE24 endopeptidase
VFGLIVFLVLFYVSFRVIGWMQGRWGSRWGIRSLDDLASLPLVVLVLLVLVFLSSPVLNAYSRHVEHQADEFGLELTHGLVADSSQVAAQSFQILGQQWLDYPYPNRFAVFWDWTHPPTRDRIHFALNYDPWDHGRSPEFIK